MQHPSHHRRQSRAVSLSLHRQLIAILVSLSSFRYCAASEVGGATPRQKDTVRYSAPCSPSPILREGHLCIPVKWVESELGAAIQSVTARQTTLRYYGHTLVVTEGSRDALVDQKPVSLAVPPFVSCDRTYVPAVVMATVWGISVRATDGGALEVTQPPTRVAAVRYSISPERVRVVLDLDHPAGFITTAGKRKFLLTLRSVTAGDAQQSAPGNGSTLLQPLSLSDVLVSGVRFTGAPSAGTQAEVALKYPAPVRTFTLNEPPRIVIDCEKIFKEFERTTLRPGMDRIAMRLGTANGPVEARAVKFTVKTSSDSSFLLRPSLANDRIAQVKPTTEIARREGALAATNGGYFAGNGSPLGVLVIDGEWIKTNHLVRTGLIVTRSGNVVIDTLRWRGEARLGADATIRIGALNNRIGATNGALAFTRRWGESLNLLPGETAIVVSQSKVVETQVGSAPQPTADASTPPPPRAVPIPDDGFLLCVSGQDAQQAASFSAGASCVIHWGFDQDYGEVLHALGAGPRLVKDGRECITDVEENFKRDITVGRAPRTAVGLTKEQELILLTVDGRQPLRSIGVTLQQLAGLMMQLGAVDAMNLDGGSSTTFALDGKLANVPSDGSEKRVSNALVVVPRM